MPKPLAVIPTYVRRASDIELLAACLRTLRQTASDRCDILVVDDCSPEEDLLAALRRVAEKYYAEVVVKPENEGFSRTVNVGLRRALVEGRDAILVNSDIEFITEDWLERMVAQERLDGDGLASMVGALLLYPPGELIAHAGIYFSMLTRGFDHRYRFGPADLPEALEPITCPVTGALQFIRHECLEEVGIYDESFRLGFEDVDYNVRTWLSGRGIAYQPAVRAIHHEYATRGQVNPKIAEWTELSWRRFCGKWADQSFASFVPSLTFGAVEITSKNGGASS